jgi:glycosyltransferase involved in cell wall biosynthesis
MKVGLFVGDMQPTEGGGYTLFIDLLAALSAARTYCGHELVLCHYGAGEEIARLFPEFPALRLEGENADVVTTQEYYQNAKKRIPVPEFVRRIKQALFPKKTPVHGQPASLEEQIYRREGVQFLIRLAPWLEGITMDIPFAMMVWDLQHRNSPWFPEVSDGTEWSRREKNYAELLRRASVLYTGTDRGRQEIVSYYHVPTDRIKLLPLATPAFALAKASVPSDPKRLSLAGLPEQYIFYPAQFWPHKNHVVMLEACKIIRDRTGWDLGVVFCGADKGNLSYVRQYASRLGLESVTRFLGFVDRPSLVELYERAFCLTFPTLFGPDNLPPLEAFGIGCPVVASDVPGAREQLGEAAMLFPPTDENALAEAILSLRNAETREKFITAGRIVAARYSWDDYAKGIIKSLDEFAAIRRVWP